MKTISKQVENIMNQENYSYHPSREDEIRIERLERICKLLAREIDTIIMNNY